MKKYKVITGTVHENGAMYQTGQEFYTTPERALQLGLGTKIEEVTEPAPGNDTGTDAAVTAQLETALNDLAQANDENARLKADNESKDSSIAGLTSSLELAAAENKDLAEKLAAQEKVGAEASDKIAALEKANAELGGQLETKAAEIEALKKATEAPEGTGDSKKKK